jgi:metacaspase-1
MKILYVHGINVPEDGGKCYDVWQDAISVALKKYGYEGAVNWAGALYNHYFQDPPDAFEYILAVAELLATLPNNAAVKQLKKMKSPQPEPSESFDEFLQWGPGMVAKYVVQDDMREHLRSDFLLPLIKKENPDLICAHSLGSLLCYDLAANGGPEGRAAFANRTLVTFGSQISNPFIRGRLWPSSVSVIKGVDFWYNLYNPNDPVFVTNIKIPKGKHFESLVFCPAFGGQSFDVGAHSPTEVCDDSGNCHPGYLDNSQTAEVVWKPLAKKFSQRRT